MDARALAAKALDRHHGGTAADEQDNDLKAKSGVGAVNWKTAFEGFAAAVKNGDHEAGRAGWKALAALHDDDVGQDDEEGRLKLHSDYRE